MAKRLDCAQTLELPSWKLVVIVECYVAQDDWRTKVKSKIKRSIRSDWRKRVGFDTVSRMTWNLAVSMTHFRFPDVQTIFKHVFCSLEYLSALRNSLVAKRHLFCRIILEFPTFFDNHSDVGRCNQETRGGGGIVWPATPGILYQFGIKESSTFPAYKFYEKLFRFQPELRIFREKRKANWNNWAPTTSIFVLLVHKGYL